MGKSRYGVVARLVSDGGRTVRVPPELGTPRSDQMLGEPGERLSELAARCCYDSLGRGRSSGDHHKHLHEVGHFSVYEHPQMTVFVGNERMEFGRTLQARTLVNRPGLWTVFTKEGARLTFNPRVLLDWDQWSDPEDPDAPWLKDVLHYYAEQDWPRITPCEAHRTAENCARVTLSSRRVVPEHEEEKWVSLFVAGSRGMAMELQRHGDRTGISGRSTRFVAEEESPWVDSPVLQEYLAHDPGEDEIKDTALIVARLKDDARAVYGTVAARTEKWLLSRGVDKGNARKQARGAARAYLGNGLYTEFVFSASVGQWKRMLRLRCNDGADSEIRALFVEVLAELKASRYGDDLRGLRLREAGDFVGEVLVETPSVEA